MTSGDDYDGIQYDTFYDPSPGQTEADEILRECMRDPREHTDTVLIIRPY